MSKTLIVTAACLTVLALTAAIRDAYGAVPYTFSAGKTARAAEVNANFGNLDTRLNSLEGGQQGSTISDGCRDKSPSMPDCTFCPAGNCVIGSTAYPAANWVYLAKYTLPAHGELSVSVKPSIVCGNKVGSGTVLGISLALADADAVGFPPADPAGGVIEHTQLILTSLPEYQIIPWNTALLVGRTPTQGVLTPGKTYKIFLTAKEENGSVSGDCMFIEAPVNLQFTPLPAANVTITPN